MIPNPQSEIRNPKLEIPQLENPKSALPELEGYDMIDCIGRGSMGLIYEAYQESTGRRVAVKFMKDGVAAGESGRQRFEREVDLIARLQHPHIVSILDSGLHRGRYYYVMEYIPALPLDKALVPGRCDVRDTLKLMAAICEAVDYAHQRGVLHRDLKPSNIIIDERGQPHVLDFGLAKAIDPDSQATMELTLSQPGQLLGTLGYMSPEQSRGQVEQTSIRSDVYALGAIVYQLITGRLLCAIDGPLAMILTRITDQNPPRPSTLRRSLSPDVDAILLKALEKQAAERYATAADMAADIRRYLADEPVLARTTGWGTKAWRWARRNRFVASLSAAAAATILSLTTVYVVSLRQERKDAQAARTDAELQAAKAQEAVDKVIDIINYVDPNVSGKADLTVREQFDDLAARLDKPGNRLSPEVEAVLRETVGRKYITLKKFSFAQHHLAIALDLYKNLRQPPDEARAKLYLGAVLGQLGKYGEAEPLLVQSLEARRQLFTEESEEAAECLQALARIWRRQGKYAEAEDYFHRALDIQSRLLGDDHIDTALTNYSMGLMYLNMDRLEAAERHLLRSLEGMGYEGAKKRWEEGRIRQKLGEGYLKMGDLELAECQLCEALDIQLRCWGPEEQETRDTVQLIAELNGTYTSPQEAMDQCGIVPADDSLPAPE